MTLLKRLILSFCLAVAGANAASVALGTATGAAGSVVNVSVPLTSAGAQVAGVQFDITYDNTALSLSVAVGSAANAAAKFVSTSNLSSGTVKRVIVSGFNTNIIADGSVAEISVTIGAGAPAGTYALTVSNLSATDPNGASLPLTGTSGSVVVPATPQSITFGTLSPATLGAAPFTLSATATSGLTVGFASTTTSVCTVSGSTVTLVGAGTCSITASQAGNASYSAAAPVVQTFTVGKGSQTISFSAPAGRAFNAPAFTLTATASSGLAVAFASATTSVCTVSGSTVTLVAPGNCSITASQAGDSNYNAASPVSQSFTVGMGSQSITFSPLSSAAFGSAPFALTATASSGLPVSFASTTMAVCTVSASTVTIVAPGACSITATQAGDTNYTAAVPVTQGFTVTPGSQTITFAAPSGVTFGAAPFALTATASSGLTVSFASTTTPVCTVSGSMVTIVTAGTCSITASQAGNTNYAAAATVSQSFTVAKASQTISFGALTGQTYGGSPFAVSATASSGLTVSFASTTPGSCTVSGGQVTLVSAGTCTIAASQTGDSNYSAATTVTQSFTISPGSQTITFGALTSVTYGVSPIGIAATASSGLPVAFSSTTPAVCTVSGASVTITGAGTCSITAAQAGNGNFSAAASVTQTFSVSPASQTITFAQPPGQALSAPAYMLSATASSGLTVSFASTTTTVCTVSGTTATMLAVGTCSITASQAGNSNYNAAVPVTQSFAVSPASQTITFGTLSGSVYGAAPITLTATASSSLPVSFASTTSAVCTVSGSTVTIVGAGTCSITASQAGNAGFGAAPNVTQSFSVAKAAQTVSFGPLGNRALSASPVTISATSTSTLAVSFASTTASVCTVSGSVVTLLTLGTCTISASQAGDPNYNAAASVSQSFTVTVGSQTITFGPLSNATFGDTPIALSATASSGLSVSFASTTLTVCTVSGSVVTLVGAGTCSITASQAGNASYSAAPGVTQNLTVAKASQTLSFGTIGDRPFNPASFALTASASSGLGVSFASATTAVCTVSGSSVTMLATGTCSVVASQTGNANYNAATAVTQSFTVTPGSQTITFVPQSNVAAGTPPFQIGATSSAGLPVTFASMTLPVCTVSGSLVTIVGAGTCTLAASQAGNGAYGAATTVTQSFTVLAAPACMYSLTSSAASIPLGGGNGSFNLQTTPNCSWTAVSNNSWLTVTTGTAGTDSGTIAYSAAPNATTSQRSGTITAGGQTFTVTQFAASCSFALSAAGVDLTAAGGSVTISISGSTTGCAWSSSASAAGVTISPASGTAPGQVTVAVGSNTGVPNRVLTPTIGGQTFTINQAGINCAVTLGATSASVAASGGSGSVRVTVPAGCSYSTVSSATWISVTSAGSGSSSGTLLYTVNANSTSVTRTGTLTIGGTPLAITQQGLACTVSLDTSSLGSPFGSAGGTGSVAISVNSAGCSWLARSGAPWAAVSPSEGTGAGTLSVTVAANSSGSPRSGVLNVGGQAINISQAGPACSYSLRSGDGSTPESGGTGTVGVIAASGCSWTSATNNPTWLTIVSSDSSGTGEVKFSVAPNTTATTRTGTLTVAGQTYTVTEAGATCAYSLNLGSAAIGSGATGGSVTFSTPTTGCAGPVVTSRSHWLTFTQSFSGSAGSVNYTAEANSSGSTRTGTIQIGKQTFTVSQAGASCSYTLNANGAVFGSAGGTGSILATASSAGCTPAVTSSPPGVVPLGSLTGPVSNVYTQTYTVPAFTSATNAVRVVTIMLGGQVFQIKQRSF